MNRLSYLFAVATFCSSSVCAQYAPSIPLEADANFLRLPEGVYFGEVPAVAVNSQGHIFVFTRSNPSGGGPAYGIHAAQLFEFDATGSFIREHGRGLYAWAFAHGVRTDADDNIWTVDKGSNMVVRMDPRGRVVWVFGRTPRATGGRPRAVSASRFGVATSAMKPASMSSAAMAVTEAGLMPRSRARSTLGISPAARTRSNISSRRLRPLPVGAPTSGPQPGGGVSCDSASIFSAIELNPGHISQR